MAEEMVMRKRVLPQSHRETVPAEDTASSSPVTRSPHPTYTHSSPLHSPVVATWFPYTKEQPWLRYTSEVNVLWWVVVTLAFVTRFWRLDYPHYVIFDEVHFGKFASYYLTRTFFFDVHPPLGKLIFAALGYSTGFNGSFLFTNIGIEYPHLVPYVLMRSVSGLAGSLLVPCVYQIMVELGFSHRAAILASLFTILDNSLVIQSRVIMLDACVIFLSYLSVLCYLKFYHLRHRPFTGAWHRGLILTGLALGTLLGVKYTGLLGLGCVGLLTMCDLWQLIADTTIDLLDFLLHVLLRAVYLLGIPLVISLLLFYIHFSILIYSGPGNAFVSRPFKKTLTGTYETTPEPIELSPNATLLRYGSHISLRSSELSCWLHSHSHLYPLKYPDDRGSSYQQQVTCYEFADQNNLWAIRRPAGPTTTAVGPDSSPVRNKDLVELVHINTSKILNSHDVAAPLTPTHQEVACYINYSSQFTPYLSWKLDVVGMSEEEPIFLEKGKLKLKFIHEHSKQALSSTGNKLPEWAFQQYEVVTDRAVESSAAVWTLDDITLPHTDNTSLWEEEERVLREKRQGKMKEEEVQREEEEEEDGLNFWEKYIEMQVHMATAHGNLGEHQFGAPPHNWPLMGKTLPYWLDEGSNAQVTLIGNPILWWTSSASILVFLFLSAFYLLRRRRHIFDLPHGELAVFQHWWTSGCVLFVGWLAHYAPYFLLSRVLFLHHYLPAIPFKLMLLAAVCDHVYTWIRRFPRPFTLLYYAFLALLLISFLISFFIFAPFTYGYPNLTREQIDSRKWVSSWDLLHR